MNQFQSFSRFDLDFSQGSKRIFRKLQYKKIFFKDFESLPRSSRKMILYLSTKRGIIKP